MRLFDSKDPAVAAVMADAPRIADALSDAAAAHYCRAYGQALDAIGIAYVQDPGLVRGLDYYTHTVFEFTCDRLGAQSGIGGGGRYDGLVHELGGPELVGGRLRDRHRAHRAGARGRGHHGAARRRSMSTSRPSTRNRVWRHLR